MQLWTGKGKGAIHAMMTLAANQSALLPTDAAEACVLTQVPCCTAVYCSSFPQ